jgi:hypothetical protein
VREERIHMLHRDFNMVMIEKYEWLVSDE